MCVSGIKCQDLSSRSSPRVATCPTSVWGEHKLGVFYMIGTTGYDGAKEVGYSKKLSTAKYTAKRFRKSCHMPHLLIQIFVV